jgi:hypothetical protein
MKRGARAESPSLPRRRLIIRSTLRSSASASPRWVASSRRWRGRIWPMCPTSSASAALSTGVKWIVWPSGRLA